MKTLSQIVKERQEFVEKTVDDVSSLLRKYGKTTSYEQHSCHTTQTDELKDFREFSFYSHGSYTMFGGETVKIWYKNYLVFEVEWWDIKECKVKKFENEVAWIPAFKKLIKEQEKIARDLLKKQMKKNASLIASREKEMLENLENEARKEAERLGLL